MDHYFDSEAGKGRRLPERRASDYLRDCPIYLTTEAEECYLPRVLEFVGEDRIMVSADMPHGVGRENAVDEIEERPDLTPAQKQRLLHDNAATFYELP
jgi:predicted TIM-barrel fold metal-dependent hydrolase